jgi:hypothetical protein
LANCSINFIAGKYFAFLLVSVWSDRANAKPYTYQQKVNQGIIKEPKYTMCLRKKMVAYKGGLACIYQGAGKTFEMEFTDVQIHVLENINVFIILTVKSQALMML